MTRKLLDILTIILFLIPFTLLIVNNHTLFPFITTKAILFRILVTIGLFIAFWIYLLNPHAFPKKNYLLLALILFLIANIISTIFSINPYRSFWGNAERMEGTWSLFFYLSYFFLLFTLFQFKPQSKKIIFYSIVIVSIFISIFQIYQAFVLKIDRPSSTLGNATYVGFFNLLVIFLLIFFYFESKNKIIDSIIIKLIFIFLILLNLISLISSQTRGSILGLIAGILAFVVFYFIFSNTEFKKKVLIFALTIIFLLGFYLFLQTNLALKIPGIKRLSETLHNPISVFPRLYAWKIFLNGFKEKQIFGWGPETLPEVFFRNFDQKIFLYEKAIFDRPHNKFIEILVSTGIFGFITWILIFIAFLYYLLKSNLYLNQKATLFAFISAYLAQNFTLFDMQASYILFFFGLSLVVQQTEIKENKERFIRPYLIALSGLALIAIIIHIRHFYIVNQIITTLRNPNTQSASENFLRLSEIAGPFLSEEANIATNYLTTKIKNKEMKTIDSFFNIYKVVEKAYKKDPYNYKLAINYIEILNLTIQIKQKIGINPEKEITTLKNIFENLLTRYPNNYEIYLSYATILKILGEQKEAIDILEKGEKIAKVYPKYYLESANILLENLNEKELAYQKLKKINNLESQLKDDREFKIALNVYASNQDKENLKKIISVWLKKNPSTSTIETIKEILKKYSIEKL